MAAGLRHGSAEVDNRTGLAILQEHVHVTLAPECGQVFGRIRPTIEASSVLATGLHHSRQAGFSRGDADAQTPNPRPGFSKRPSHEQAQPAPHAHLARQLRERNPDAPPMQNASRDALSDLSQVHTHRPFTSSRKCGGHLKARPTPNTTDASRRGRAGTMPHADRLDRRQMPTGQSQHEPHSQQAISQRTQSAQSERLPGRSAAKYPTGLT